MEHTHETVIPGTINKQDAENLVRKNLGIPETIQIQISLQSATYQVAGEHKGKLRAGQTRMSKQRPCSIIKAEWKTE